MTGCSTNRSYVRTKNVFNIEFYLLLDFIKEKNSKERREYTGD